MNTSTVTVTTQITNCNKCPFYELKHFHHPPEFKLWVTTFLSGHCNKSNKEIFTQSVLVDYNYNIEIPDWCEFIDNKN
jgi:hypothetical protein